MTEEVAKPSSPDAPFASSPHPANAAHLSSGSVLVPDAKSGVKSAHSTSFIASDADPYALLYSNPAHAPPSLAQRAHGTETLFQYYAQRGYKELLVESNRADADKAVQSCLDGKADALGEAVPATSANGHAGQQFGIKQKKTQPQNTHVIDRCLAELPEGVSAPLRPPQAQDRNSLYLLQQADDDRAQATARRRAHLRQPPAESAYMGRYYPTGLDVLPSVKVQERAGSGSVKSAALHSSPSASLRQSASMTGTAVAHSPTFTLAPEEVAVHTQQQLEVRRQLAQQIDDVFAAAFRLRNPDAAAAQQQRARESDAASRGNGEGAKKRKSTARAASAAAAAAGAASTCVEGAFPANLSLFRSSLLLLCNEDGAVTLDQLCSITKDVPFNVPQADAAGTSGSGAVQKLFRVLHASTRAPNATDATDLLLAVASATAPGGLSARHVSGQNDSSISYTAATASGGGNAAVRLGNTSSTFTGNGRRAIGASVSNSATLGGLPNRGTRPSVLSASRGGAAPAHPPATSVSFASNAYSMKTPQPSVSGVWKDAGSSLGSPSPQQCATNAAAASPELKDGRRCVLVLEVLDALDALLNSPETRQVVRWECFAVLAVEGHGYIHKSQLVHLRRHAYRGGSAAEANAAVTASMVHALEDAFSVVAAEEEAAYLKANKKGRKGSGGGAAPRLNSNQKSSIPLHVMRKSHMDFVLFCRFFDELPHMSAAFAHVWLPLLMEGARRREAMTTSTPASPLGDPQESGTCAGVKAVLTESSAAPEVEVGKRDETDGAGSAEAASRSSVARESSATGRAHASFFLSSSSSEPATAPGVSGREEDSFPLELLGNTPSARQRMIQQLLAKRLEQLQDACDVLDRERLQEEPLTGSGAFGGPDAAVAA